MMASARIALARLHHSVGIPGVVGLILAVTAVAGAGVSWRERQRFEAQAHAVVSAMPAGVAMRPRPPVSLPLRPASDVPLLLARMERAALQEALGWPRADYRINLASDEAPASLEVHCSLKGPYPNIRRFVTTLLQDTPTLTLREFSISRPTVDAIDVEAKLGIVVYLASDMTQAPVPNGSTR